MAAIELARIEKRFGRVAAVAGIDLTVADGEFVVLVGPSGCGKSTTLRMIAGLEDATAGTIAIDGRVVNRVEPKDRNIAMVFQNYAIYPHMSVAKNIGFGLHRSRMDRAEKERRIAETARILGLEPLLSRRPSELSGGQRQRVAIGRAMVRNPVAFLFDEPLSNLDAQLRAQMRVEIKKLHQRLGATIVFVTHDQVEAMTMADRIVVMREGRILQAGAPMELYDRPADVFTARFIGSPMMNILPARLDRAAGRLDLAEVVGSVGSPPRRLVDRSGDDTLLIGARPQDLALIDGAGSGSGLVLEGTVSVVEPLGPETFVHIDSGSQTVVATAPGEAAPKVGQPVRAFAPLPRLKFFDAASEKALPLA
jgi:multiple sugar transport system ATP-binding protein